MLEWPALYRTLGKCKRNTVPELLLPLVLPHPFSYLKNQKSRSRRNLGSMPVLEPRERAIVKADRRISRCLLSVPSYPTLVLLEEVAEFSGLPLGLAQKSFTAVL